MTKDLIENHLNSELSYQKVIKNGFVIDSIDLIIAYHISEKYGLNIYSIKTKSLLIYLNNDPIIQKSKLKHYKNRPAHNVFAKWQIKKIYKSCCLS